MKVSVTYLLISGAEIKSPTIEIDEDQEEEIRSFLKEFIDPSDGSTWRNLTVDKHPVPEDLTGLLYHEYILRPDHVSGFRVEYEHEAE